MNSYENRTLRLVVTCLFLLTYLIPPGWCWEHNESPGAAAPVSMNLSSRRTSVTVMPEHLNGATEASILVGGAPMAVQAGQSITPAQFAALSQVVSGTQQSLMLNELGQAVGGTFQLSSLVASSNSFKCLVVPQNVTVLQNAESPLNLTGFLINNGSLFAYSSNSAVTNAVMSANSIVNNSGALISTMVPEFYGLNNGNLDLTLNALNSISNFGAVSSSGNLNLNAGGAITNAGTLQGAQNLNLMSNVGHITNSGMMSALAGNLNVNSLPSHNLEFNNMSGSMQALNGSINFRDAQYSGTSDMSIARGELLAKAVNLNSGGGKANLNVDNFQGTLNAKACNVVAWAPSDNLVLGNFDVSGDPVLLNPNGNAQITGNMGPGPILIAAKGDVMGLLPGPSTLSSGGLGDIMIVAGVTITQNGNDISVGGASTTGGDIQISSTDISTNSSTGNANNIFIIAYKVGTKGNVDMFQGGVRANVTANSTFAGGHGGDITIIGGGDGVSTSGWALPNVSSTGAQGGNYSVFNAQPTTTDAQPLVFNATTGAKTSANSFIPSNTWGSANVGTIIGTTSKGNILVVGNGQLVPGDMNTNGGNVTLVAGKSISYVGIINTSAASATAGNIFMAAGVSNLNYTGTQVTFSGTSAEHEGSINVAANIVNPNRPEFLAQGTVNGDITLLAYRHFVNDDHGQIFLPKNVVGHNMNIIGMSLATPTIIANTVTATGDVQIAGANFTTNSGSTVAVNVPSGTVASGPFTLSAVPSGPISLNGVLTAVNATVQALEFPNDPSIIVNANPNVSGTLRLFGKQQVLNIQNQQGIQFNVPINAPGNLILETESGNFDLPLKQNITVAGSLTIKANGGGVVMRQITNTLKAETLVLHGNNDVVVDTPVTFPTNLTLQSNTGKIIQNQDITVSGKVSFAFGTTGQVVQTLASGKANNVTNKFTNSFTRAALNQDNSRVLVLGGFVASVLDTKTGQQLSSFQVGQSSNLTYGAFSVKSGQMFVSGNSPGNNRGFLFIVEGNNVVQTIDLGGTVTGMVANPKTNFVYAMAITNTNSGVLFVIDGTTKQVVHQVPIASAGTLAIDPNGQNLYVTHGNNVNVYRTQTNTLGASVPIAGATNFNSATMDGSGSVLYASDNTSSKVFAIDPMSLALLNTITLPTGPANNILSMQVNPQGTELYVSTPTTVKVVQANTGTVDQTLAVPNTTNASLNLATVGIVDGRFKVYVPSFAGTEDKVQLNNFAMPLVAAGGIGVNTTGNASIAAKSSGGVETTVVAANAAIADLGTPILGPSTVTGSLLMGSMGNLLVNGPVTAANLQLQTGTSSADVEFHGNSTTGGIVRLTSLDGISINSMLSGTAITLASGHVTINDGALTATSGAITFNGSPGAATLIEGTGTVTATNGVIFNASNFLIAFPQLNIDGVFTMQGGATGTVMNAVGGTVSLSQHTQITSSQFTVNTCSLDNPNALVGPVTINVSPDCQLGSGCGTLTNPSGDITLNSSMVVNSNGKSLAVIASGNIFADPGVTLNLSSPTSSGGSLTLMAGFLFTPPDQNLTRNTSTLFNVTGASPSGGSVTLPDVAINTSTTSPAPKPGIYTGQGGAVTVVAHTGTVNKGTISLGNIDTSSANGPGGAVTLIGQAGVQVGSITTKGATGGGNVQLSGAEPEISTTMQIFNGIVYGGRVSAKTPVTGVNAALVVNGPIDASSAGLNGGTVSLVTDSSITVNGLINTSVKQGGTGNGAGNVTLQGVNSDVTVNGLINAAGSNDASTSSALNAVSGGNVTVTAGGVLKLGGSVISKGGSTAGTANGANAGKISLTSGGLMTINGDLDASGGNTQSKTTGTGGKGGAIVLAPKSFLRVSGNILAGGGSTQGSANGGNGGSLDLQTGTTVPTGSNIGNATIKGYIDISGGDSKSGRSGDGGNLVIKAGSLVVSGQSNGNSINASFGKGAFNGRNGKIEIKTYSVQSLPVDLDTTRTRKSVVALPGGMFSVGENAGINGTTGAITNGRTTANNKNASRVAGGSPFNQFELTITILGGAYNVNVGGTVTGIGPDNGSGVRTTITPATAMALYTISRDPGNPPQKQTIGLNADGQAINTPPTGGNSRITVNSYDFPSDISSFNLSTVDTDNTNKITITVNGTLPIDLSGVTNSTINGTWAFNAGTTLLFGNGLTVGATGTLSAAGNSTMNMSGFASVSNLGKILATTIQMTPKGGSNLILTMGTTGQIGTSTGTGNILINSSGVNITGGTILNSVLSVMPVGAPNTVSITSAYQGTAALGNITGTTITITAPAGSAISIANNSTVNGTKVNITTPLTLTLGTGALIFSGINVATGGLLTVDANGGITLSNTAGMSSRNDMKLTSTAGAVTLGTGAILLSNAGDVTVKGTAVTLGLGSGIKAGTLKGPTPPGIVKPSDILSSGSITITSTNGDVTINSDTGNVTVINSIGANTSIYASANLTIGNAALFEVDGGNLLIGANQKLDGGSGNSFVAKSLNSTGGGIALGSIANVQTVLPANLKAASQKPSGTAPTPTTLGTNVQINNGTGTTGAITVNTTTSPSINLSTANQAVLTLQGGAMNFTAGPSTTPNEIHLQGGTFNTFGLVPMGFHSDSQSETGEAIIDTNDVCDDEDIDGSETAMQVSF
jgi:hypothetical protein